MDRSRSEGPGRPAPFRLLAGGAGTGAAAFEENSHEDDATLQDRIQARLDLEAFLHVVLLARAGLDVRHWPSYLRLVQSGPSS